MADASAILNGEKNAADFPGARQVRKATAPKQDFAAIYAEADTAGMAAGNAAQCVPMVVQEHSNPLDDSSPVVKTYEPVMDGVCGFAWVNIKGNTAFAKWAKENKLARAGYSSGLNFWVHQFNQSMTRKADYAAAFADVLNAHKITAYAGSRID